MKSHYGNLSFFRKKIYRWLSVNRLHMKLLKVNGNKSSVKMKKLRTHQRFAKKLTHKLDIRKKF